MPNIRHIKMSDPVRSLRMLILISYGLFFCVLSDLVTLPKWKKAKRHSRTNEEIVQQNTETKYFYLGIIATVNLVYFALAFVILKESFTWLNISMLMTTELVYIACFLFMVKVSSPSYGPTGYLVKVGADLNIEGNLPDSLFEKVYISPMITLSKDMIILLSAVQVLSLFSDNFWLLWLPILVRATIPCIGCLSQMFLLTHPSS